jgi:hypothetical protein
MTWTKSEYPKFCRERWGRKKNSKKKWKFVVPEVIRQGGKIQVRKNAVVVVRIGRRCCRH